MSVFKRRRKRARGFTLIELMTVIFIMALLMSISIPVYRRSIDKARFNVCQSNLRNLVTALENYHLDNHGYPNGIADLLPNNYINSIPTCPSASRDTYSEGYEYDNVSGEFTIACKGNFHVSIGFAIDQPYYVFSTGMGP
jgi:general secretion pathway protein G